MSCFWVAYGEVFRMGGVALGEVSVTHWRAMRGVDAMIEKSRSAVSLRRSKASFKARNEFGWSVERGTVDVQLEDCGGSVGGEK